MKFWVITVLAFSALVGATVASVLDDHSQFWFAVWVVCVTVEAVAFPYYGFLLRRRRRR